MSVAGSTPRRATWWQRLALVVASPLLFVALLEVGIRVSGVSTDLARNKGFKIALPTWVLADNDWVRAQQRRMETHAVRAEDVAWLANFEEARYIGMKLRPHLDVHVVNPFNQIEVAKKITFHLTSNGDGFRGPEFAPGRPEVLRVVTLGDSSTFGWGVDPEFTYQELLAKRLRARGRPAEVFNLGMPGTTTRHGLGVIAHYGAALKPDVVIVSFGANDARLTLRTAAEELDADDTWLGGMRWSLLRWKTFGLMRRLIFTWYDPFQARPSSAPAAPRALVKAVALPDYVSNLRRLRGRATVSGARTIFMAVCTPPDYVDRMRETAGVLREPFVDAGSLFMAKAPDVAAGKLYPVEEGYYEGIYGTAAMKENWRLYVTTDGCHPNRVGHSIIADALADIIANTAKQ